MAEARSQGDKSDELTALSGADAVRRLETDLDSGLSGREVRRRRRRYGANRMPAARPRGTWGIFVDQWRSLVVGLLAVAALAAAVFGQWIEAVAIAGALLINTQIGFVTELRATRSMEALRRMGRTKARVRRDGREQSIVADALVPGDVVLLGEGDIVPADIRLVETSNLACDESALTGESEPVAKDEAPLDEAESPLARRFNMAFRGTAVTSGQATGVVAAIGAHTQVGRIAELTYSAEAEATPLERRLDRLGQRLVWVVVAVALAVSVSGILAGRDLLLMIETGIALAVAAVPEGLPIVATIALARGMWRMARRNAVVKRLSSVETLGSATVILADKTGTLTENRMTLRAFGLPSGQVARGESGQWTGGGDGLQERADAELRRALRVAALCNNATMTEDEDRHHGDPMELALLAAAAETGQERAALLEAEPEVREESFSRETSMMATVHDADGGYRVAVKGAPEAVLDACTRVAEGDDAAPFDDDARRAWDARAGEMASQGLRVLALAEKTAKDPDAPVYEGLTLLGLAGLHDPPRPAVEDAVEACRQAGIRVVMVTGDQAATAASIARQTGLVREREPHVLTGDTSDDEADAALKADVFARISPETKLHLVEIHQKAGGVVAMTGDGVNDAPALKKADIGIAMGGRGTEVAREAGDIVLKDDAFETIVAAIEQGRAIFANIRRFIVFLLSGNLGEVLAVALTSLMGMPLPLLPLQILFINLLLDVFPALALGIGPGARDTMRRPPRDPKEPILTGSLWAAIGGYGAMIALSVLAVFAAAHLWLNMETAQAVSVSFLAFGFARLGHVFNMRSPGSPLLSNEVTRNPAVWGAILLCGLLLAAAVYVPGLSAILDTRDPGLAGWLLVAAGSLAPLLLGQLALEATRILRRAGKS
ncbi:cation-translocating P-type ATPase [Ferruginivarius sediminum]|uniref:P-type Cu(+) transporter n=1 Tax=Ferruginivarius sediminum TaxID=2661937 RepID=A0A369TCD5_9PROT|nr:cation-transporting P-type ATPase [Ferruginivarius sediminum]RDD61827.1 cation-transporting P-type ATPase [Ferruginivarius sediminum]